MSKVGRPRVHNHVSRETIARAALELVDRKGLEALSMRNVAATLGIGTMTLYGHVRTRDEIVSGIVELLLGEVDTRVRAEERWDDSLRRVAASVRKMALRHPPAFALVATAPVDQPPVLDYARSIARLEAVKGISEEQFADSWRVVDAFLTGFLLMETAAIVRGGSSGGKPVDAALGDESLQRLMADAHSAEAFHASLEVIITGLRDTREAASS